MPRQELTPVAPTGTRPDEIGRSAWAGFAVQAFLQVNPAVGAEGQNRLSGPGIDRLQEMIAGEKAGARSHPWLSQYLIPRSVMISAWALAPCIQTLLPVTALSATMESFSASTQTSRCAPVGLKQYRLSSPVGGTKRTNYRLESYTLPVRSSQTQIG
jgi:hypothetical protein